MIIISSFVSFPTNGTNLLFLWLNKPLFVYILSFFIQSFSCTLRSAPYLAPVNIAAIEMYMDIYIPLKTCNDSGGIVALNKLVDFCLALWGIYILNSIIIIIYTILLAVHKGHFSLYPLFVNICFHKDCRSDMLEVEYQRFSIFMFLMASDVIFSLKMIKTQSSRK